jgi:hypothetical protein
MKRQASNTTPTWFLEALVEANRYVDGILAETLQAGIRRQNVVAAALALTTEPSPGQSQTMMAAAKALKSERTNALLKGLYPDLPDTFFSLVANPKHAIQDRAFYHRLKRFLKAKNVPKTTLQCLRQSRRIDTNALNVLSTLEEVAHFPLILDVVPGVGEAQKLQAQIDLVHLLLPDLSIRDLRRALFRMATKQRESINSIQRGDRYVEPPPSLIDELLRHIRFPEPPLKEHHRLVPLRSPKDMVRAGLHFRNCASRLIENATLKSNYYYLWFGRDSVRHRAFVELERAGMWWRLSGMKGSGNCDVPPEAELLLVDDLKMLGVITVKDWPPQFLSDFSWFDPNIFFHEWNAAANPQTETGLHSKHKGVRPLSHLKHLSHRTCSSWCYGPDLRPFIIPSPPPPLWPKTIGSSDQALGESNVTLVTIVTEASLQATRSSGIARQMFDRTTPRCL